MLGVNDYVTSCKLISLLNRLVGRRANVLLITQHLWLYIVIQYNQPRTGYHTK